MTNDTIVALATPPGDSAVAVLRLSGPRALSIAARHFQGRRSPERSASHRILFGTFLKSEAGEPLDTVLISVFRAPRSYTGEDVVEISSHGGSTIPSAILDCLIRSGARPARPGEFTERAFRNGKLDLSQAESVAALVKARSEKAIRAANATLGGALARRLNEIDRELVSLLAEVEARIDFPNDVGEELDGPALARRCGAIAGPIRDWIEQLPSARRREQGVRVALVGRPNVGKSSLLNALLGYERAIVSDIPGTTRDTIEESIWLDGVEVRLTDSAGVRGSSDRLERLGLERTRHAAEAADLAILVLDRSEPWHEDDRAAAAVVADRPTLLAWNKADLACENGGNGENGENGERGGNSERGGNGAQGFGVRALAEVSTVAVRPGGAEPLRAALRDALSSLMGAAAVDELPVTSARQELLLAGALDALGRAQAGLECDASYDLIAVDLTEARRLLGEIIGRGVDQTVIDAIFSQFCIGK